MTTTLQAVEIGGQVVWVEVAESAIAAPAPTPRSPGLAASPTRGRLPDNAVQGAAQNAVEAVGRIDFARTLSAVVTPVHEALKSLSPDEVTVELSLGIKGEVGIFIASGEGNASVKISAKWKFDPKAG